MTGSAPVLVTGGSGFFGSALVRRLCGDGVPCRVFDIVDDPDRPPQAEIRLGDIRDYAVVENACRGIEVVHHNVAQVPLAKDERLFREVNLEGTENLLSAALSTGVRKVIYTSTSAVYGVPERNPVTEETPPSPADPYGRAKLQAESRCAEYAARGLDVTIIRPRTILGPGRLGIFQVLFEWIRRGVNVPVLGSGDNVYQFIHADDLVEACLLAAARPGSTAYNCGAERFGTMREGLETLCRHAGTGSRVRSVPRWPAEFTMQITSVLGLSPLGAYHALMYGRSLYFDITRARAELGWHPHYSNAEMLIDSYEWYVANHAQIADRRGASHHRSAVRRARALRLVEWLL